MEKMAGSAESYVRVVSCNAVIGSCERSYKELCVQKVFLTKVSGLSGDLVCLHMWPDQVDLGQSLCAGWIVCLAACTCGQGTSNGMRSLNCGSAPPTQRKRRVTVEDQRDQIKHDGREPCMVLAFAVVVDLSRHARRMDSSLTRWRIRFVRLSLAYSPPH